MASHGTGRGVASPRPSCSLAISVRCSFPAVLQVSCSFRSERQLGRADGKVRPGSPCAEATNAYARTEGDRARSDASTTMTFSEVNKEVNFVLEAFDEVEWNTLFATYLDAQAAVEADTGTKRTFVEQYKDCLLRETPVAACAKIGDGTRYSTAALPSISDGGESLADTFTEPGNVCTCPLL